MRHSNNSRPTQLVARQHLPTYERKSQQRQGSWMRLTFFTSSSEEEHHHRRNQLPTLHKEMAADGKYFDSKVANLRENLDSRVGDLQKKLDKSKIIYFRRKLDELKTQNEKKKFDQFNAEDLWAKLNQIRTKDLTQLPRLTVIMGESPPCRDSVRSIKEFQRQAITAKQWPTRPENDPQITFSAEDAIERRTTIPFW